MRRFLLVLLTLPGLNLAAADDPLPPRLELSEIVADPQTDRTGDGRVTPSDEFVELWNPTDQPVDLAGWALWLNDTTPVLVPLSGLVPAAGRWVILNPPGEINNNAHVALRFPGGVTADDVRYGTWPGDGPRGPDAGSQSATTEALRRVGNVWKKGHATPGSPNDEPWMSRAPPYDAADGWWDPGNATRPWTLEVTDADRAYARLGLRLVHSGIEQVWDGPAVAVGGRWRANGTLLTPKEDFESTPLASDTLGGIHAGPVTRVRVDRLPPPVPTIPVPPWVADTTVALSLIPVVDDGIGGVTYQVETADESDGPWAPHANASNPQSLPPLALEEAGQAWVRARALDAYGHASPWTPPGRIRHDADLPTPMRALAASGVEAPTLNWEAPTDPSSGVQWVIVERVEPTHRSWRLPPDARSLTDDGLRPGHAPTYRLWAVDAAGRAGPAIDYRPEWPGLYPHVRQLHASRDWWGPGTLRLRVDFDRPMDPDSDPRIALVADGQRFALLGSWLANRTSYAVRLNDSAAYPAGPALLVVAAATDAHGHALLAPAERALRLDSAPPQLRIAGSAARWINATGIRLDASDDQDAAPEIHWSVAGVQRAGGPRLNLEPANGTLHVRAYARDLAGNRSPWIERTFHVDAAPPTARLQRRTLATADLLIADDGAGLDPNQTRLPPGRWLEPPTGTGRTARYRADVTALRETLQLHLVDRVGNAADARLEILPSTPHPTTRPDRRVETLSPEAADAAPEPSRSFAMPAVDAKDVVPGLAITGLAGLALALPAARRRTRRRTPSLARRLRTHRRGAPRRTLKNPPRHPPPMPSGPSVRASAPGKVILFGEHAVVYGEASLSLAINRRIHVDGELGGSLITVNAEPLDVQHHAYIARAAELYWRGGPVRLRTQSDLPGAAGIGSSAALSVATVAALARLAGEPTDAATIAERAFHTEFETQGAASPNDTTVSTAGGAVLLGPRRLDSPDLEYLWEIRRGERAWTAHRAQLPTLPLVVATTGQRGRTSEQVAKVRRFVEHNAFGRDVIREIGRLTLDGVQALRSNDLARVGQLMNRNHELLHILGVDTPELARLVQAARRVPGTYGAKLTGAGGGGSIIALAENPRDVHAKLVRAGAKAFLVEAEARGVLLES